MFAIEKKSEQGFQKIILKDGTNNASAEIIPFCGAVLHAFNISVDGTVLNVIDNYASADDFASNVTSGGFKSCKLSPFVCRLKNATYSFGGNEYKVSKFFLGKNGHHGLLYDGIFKVIDEKVDEKGVSVKLLHEYRIADEGYPFEYDCVVTYTLSAGNTLTITSEVINRSGKAMPVQDGWHPYFTFGGSVNELFLQFKSESIVEFDAELIPTGNLLPFQEFSSLKQIEKTSFDNCYQLDFSKNQPLCVLRDNNRKLQLEIHPDASYPYLQIYIPDHRKSIAIENLSGAPDAFNNGLGLIKLDADTSISFTTVYKLAFIN